MAKHDTKGLFSCFIRRKQLNVYFKKGTNTFFICGGMDFYVEILDIKHFQTA